MIMEMSEAYVESAPAIFWISSLQDTHNHRPCDCADSSRHIDERLPHWEKG